MTILFNNSTFVAMSDFNNFLTDTKEQRAKVRRMLRHAGRPSAEERLVATAKPTGRVIRVDDVE